MTNDEPRALFFIGILSFKKMVFFLLKIKRLFGIFILKFGFLYVKN